MGNGGVFVIKAFNHFLKDHGIEKQTSIPYTPQQNGMAKHTNCIILETKRNMFHAKS